MVRVDQEFVRLEFLELEENDRKAFAFSNCVWHFALGLIDFTVHFWVASSLFIRDLVVYVSILLSASLYGCLSLIEKLIDLLLRGSSLEPRVTHNTRDAEALCGILHQHASD